MIFWVRIDQRVGYELIESAYETSWPGYESSGYETIGYHAFTYLFVISRLDFLFYFFFYCKAPLD